MKIILLGLLFVLTFSELSDAKACDDSTKIYKVCADQLQAFQSSLAEAKKQNKYLFVVVGAEWCPWCISLHHVLREPGFGGDLANKFLVADIALFNGKSKLPEGEAVVAKLQQFSGDKRKLEGIPVLALVNPANSKAILINTAPLEQNTKTTKGHDPKKVSMAIEFSIVKIK
jgi:thiol-disulfide isomerase/thioredoxin